MLITRTSRRALLALLTAAAAVLGATFAGPAVAAKPCERQVIDDWYDNGRVDQIYDARCYRSAVKILPTDVIDYSSAKDDILRALSFALRGESDPGKNGGTGTGTGTTPTTTTPTTATPTTPEPATPTTTEPTTKPKAQPGETTPAAETTDEVVEAVPLGDTSNSSSVPIPLLVLGGLAILLFAAGAAGYLTRRFRADEPGDGPPAGA